MKIPVMISIQGKQFYPEQEPEVIELVTEGTLEQTDSGWSLTYEESHLTGLEGVTTTFRLEPEKITLSRCGALTSEMVFQVGVFHESLYQMEFGAMMITVCASELSYDLSENGGTVDVTYGIDIEQSVAGVVEYHLQVTPRS